MSASAIVTLDGYRFTVSVEREAAAPSIDGVQAGRIADLLEPLGPNTFSSLVPDANLWGSYPADYSPPSVIAGMNYITNGSGLSLLGREYHYAGREAMQAAWLKQVVAATGARFSLCVGANGSLADVPSLLALAKDPANGVAWVEGINEPNNDFDSGPIPTATTLAIQAALGPASTGPSVVFGLPFPEGYITPAYFSAADLAALKCAQANGHFYPSGMCDLDDGSGRGGAFDDVVRGLAAVYGARPLVITEWHPTLFNSSGHSADDALAAYLAPIMLLSAHRLGVRAMLWFAMFDYGTTYRCGLFPRTGGVDPRPVAQALRAMFTLTGDHGATKRTFTPGKLAYSIEGLPPPVNPASPNSGGQLALFQASDGRWFLFVWNAQAMPGGPSVPITIRFAVKTTVREFNITSGNLTPLQAVASVAAVTSQLDASVRLFVIT